jgi:arylformamidase
MKITLEYQGENFEVELSSPLDISIPLRPHGPRAWYVDQMVIKPVINQYFTGSVALGGNVNFNEVYFNPHGHGTHTENAGHIARDYKGIHETQRDFFFFAKVVSVTPIIVAETDGWHAAGDLMVSLTQVQEELGDNVPEAVIIRTLPNEHSKSEMNYSDTNFPYLETSLLAWLCEKGVKHLLVDLPSVDRESDGGKLLGHRAFWSFPEATRWDATITEFVFVREAIEDGTYLLNLQIAPFDNDASPSRPLLFELKKKG